MDGGIEGGFKEIKEDTEVILYQSRVSAGQFYNKFHQLVNPSTKEMPSFFKHQRNSSFGSVKRQI